jgi:uncharacterized membrane protein
MNNINKLTSVHKLIISLIIGVVAYFIIAFADLQALPHLIFGWDIFSLCLLILTWITFYKTTPQTIRNQARRQDESRAVFFFIVLIATSGRNLGVILLLISKSADPQTKALRLVVTIACMLLSWLLVHTIFTPRYAHMYYSDSKKKKDLGSKMNEDSEDDKTEESYAAGLDFPEDHEPDFVDFAYFSFTIGMTFQVSDVSISSKEIRRLALWHCLLSFGYNATIIALSVNIIGGLTQK